MPTRAVWVCHLLTQPQTHADAKHTKQQNHLSSSCDLEQGIVKPILTCMRISFFLSHGFVHVSHHQKPAWMPTAVRQLIPRLVSKLVIKPFSPLLLLHKEIPAI